MKDRRAAEAIPNSIGLCPTGNAYQRRLARRLRVGSALECEHFRRQFTIVDRGRVWPSGRQWDGRAIPAVGGDGRARRCLAKSTGAIRRALSQRVIVN